MLNRLKSQKGITGIDISISLLIIILFISIISGLIISVSSSLTSRKALEVATNCMTEIMEKLDEIDYSSVTISETESENVISDIKKDENNNNSYPTNSFEYAVQEILNSKDEYKILTVDLVKEKYTKTGEEDVDLIKKVTVKITYQLNNELETLEVTRLKPKYNVEF